VYDVPGAWREQGHGACWYFVGPRGGWGAEIVLSRRTEGGMKQLPHVFQGLRWRLALSYILVTVVAAVTVQVAVIAATAIPAQLEARPSQPKDATMAVAKQVQLALDLELGPYLDRQPPDRAQISTLLAYGMDPAHLKKGFVGVDLYKAALAIVFDPAGQEVASASAPGADTRGLVATPQAQAVIQAALAQIPDFAHLTGALRDGRPVMAVPLRSYDGRFLGVFFGVFLFSDSSYNVVQVNGQRLQDYLVSTTTNQVVPTTLWITLAAIVVGTLFGLLTSRGITRRLRRLAGAADAWSRGELGVEVRDPGRDEVGQLARGLNSMAEQLQHLLATREELAVVEERHRLARDLHDSVKQEVFATAMQVAAARTLVERDPAAAKSRLAEAERLAGHAQQELTALIRELRPAALANKGLAPAIREFCLDWSRQTGIAPEVRVVGERPAPLEVEQALFRVAQEALANVARHSGATQVDVRVAWEGGTLSLAIQDDGRGFDGAMAEGRGVGLRSMRERVEGMGGTMLVSSTPGGTRVEARVPLPGQAETAGFAAAPAAGRRGEGRHD
jgi:two-component system, NarL family, sensor histidine kinase LiaS